MQYISSVLFGECLGLTINYITSTDEIDPKAPLITYNVSAVDKSLAIPAISLLFDTGIEKQDIIIQDWDGLPIFYSDTKHGEIPFDIFAASFYLLSRYEEYLDFEPDNHGRFAASSSLAYQYEFLTVPLINLWVQKLAILLKEKWPNLELTEPKYHFQPTFDIDYAWCFREKGIGRTMGGILKDLIRFNFSGVKDRIRVAATGKSDPFDTYDLIASLHEGKTQPLFFILYGALSKNDRNVSTNNAAFNRLIKQLSEQYEIGAHPSYRSNEQPELVGKEILELSKTVGRPITSSRQHFLKLKLPATYQILLNNGIQKDYSMGYADKLGFRASFAMPFLWYNLQLDKVTDLRIYPFSVMDVTLKNYLQLSPENAIKETRSIINYCKEVNGHFISIWHNSSFGKPGDWLGWDRVYRSIVDMAND